VPSHTSPAARAEQLLWIRRPIATVAPSRRDRIPGDTDSIRATTDLDFMLTGLLVLGFTTKLGELSWF
jgi:hypothetical protein